MTLIERLNSPRAAIMATFGAFGAVVGTFSGSVPQIMQQHGLDDASYGIGVTVMTAATVLSMSLSGTLARHASHRRLILVILPLLLGFLALMVNGATVWSFFVFALLYGVASGITDVIMNAEAGAIELALKKRVFTAFHAMASLFVAIFAIVSSLVSTRYGTAASCVVSAIPIVVAWAMVWRNIGENRLEARSNPVGQAIFSVFTPRLLLIGVAAGLVISCEVTALFWSSSLLAAGAPQLAAIAGMGAAFFGLSNAIMRFAGDGLRRRFDEITLMSVMIGIAIVGFAGLGFTDGFAANIVFFALVGIGVSILCPCLFAMAGLETPANRAAGLSVAMLVAGLPRIVMPSLVGAVSEAYSTHVAFYLCAGALVFALLIIRTFAHR